MGPRMKVLSALVAGVIGAVGLSSTAHAVLSKQQYKCQTTIAKEGAKFLNGELKTRQKCINANLSTPGSCAAPDVTKLQTKLDSGLAKACDFTPNSTPGNLAVLGFPGACPDSNSLDGFTLQDLKDCIKDSHEAALLGICFGGSNTGESCNLLADCPDSGPGTSCRGMLNVEYDSTVVAGPLVDTALKCQKEIAKNEQKLVAAILKNVQKCRNGLLNCKFDVATDTTSCKISGVQPKNCATDEPKTASAIAKARAKADDAIASKCSDLDTVALKVCEPDQLTGAAGATCESDFHNALTDNPNASAAFDLIDYEYAVKGICGDNRKNQPSEECDGVSDAACPGQCGAALGFFPCLCQNIPRTRVVEHGNADLDNGWTGQSHDSGIVEGGGYVTDLYDCDGPGGPDTLCNVGPSCSLPPHSPCSPISASPPANADTGNEICATLGQGTCRITPGGSTGPHCEQDFQKRCDSDGDCATFPGDRCLVIAHGAPLPLASGGVSVCVVNEFSEDVTGTTDLATGQGSVRLRQFSTTILGQDQQQPCPVCGGFCSGAAGSQSPGARNLCTTNADCTSPATCVTDAVCSYGPNRDLPCRVNPPGGGPTEFFGNPSVDCPAVGNILGKIDILFNPATTSSVSLTANTFCNRTGYNNKTCVGGPNLNAACLVDSECPGGTCNNQCFCGGGSQAPNACQAACVGGPDDAAPCTDNTDCTAPGFCHPADCRVNPGDLDSSNEGECTVGPGDGHCSQNSFVSCTADAGCKPPTCAFCDPSETCLTSLRQCFVNPVIQRQGVPGVPDRTSAAVFCIAATGSAAVNNVAGLPGPGAITNPTTTIEVGF